MADIEKIYSLKLEGEKDVLKNMNEISAAFDRAKQKFQELKESQGKSSLIDPAALAKETQAIMEAEKATIRLAEARSRARAEAEALTTAKKSEATATEQVAATNKTATATYNQVVKNVNVLKQSHSELGKVLESNDNEWRKWTASIDENAVKMAEARKNLKYISEQIRQTEKNIASYKVKSQTPENLETVAGYQERLVLLIKKEAEFKAQLSESRIALNAQTKELQSVDGSMAQANHTLGQMRKLWRDMTDEEKNSDFGQKLLMQIQTLDASLKNADYEIGNFYRNVGNYTNSIIDAFKASGIDVVIRNQLTGAKNQVALLDEQFEQLKQELQEVQKTGGNGLAAIERQLIANRTEAEKLRAEVERVENQLNGVGNTGSAVTNAIGEGFGKVTKNLTQMVLGFVGLQAIMNKTVGLVSQGITNAKELAGVEAAFKRLNNPNLINELRTATKGTVNDLELMKAAVNADNFGIPIKQMATFMEFAKQRADDTGQSVDHLVNSIVTGIGRKSPMILDNLGISAVRLKKEMGGVSSENATIGKVAEAVGRIIEEENKKSGESIDTVKTKLDQNKASWENLGNGMGKKVLPILTEAGAIIYSIAAFIVGIPFPFWVAGLMAVAAAYAAANSEMILSKLNAINDSIAKNAATVSTNLLAAANQILSKSLKVAGAGFKTLFNIIKANPITALVVILAGLLIWIGRIVSKNEEARKSFAAVSIVVGNIMQIFSKLFGTIANRLIPIFGKLIEQFMVPLIEKIIPPLVLGLRVLAGTINMVSGEFLNALIVGLEFAKGFVDIWEGIKNMDTTKIKAAVKRQGDVIVNGFKDIKTRMKENFLEGFNMEATVEGVDDGIVKKTEEDNAVIETKLKDRVKIIEDARDRELAILKQKRLKDEIDEETYLQRVLEINNKAINKKLALIKGANAEERKQIEILKLERLQNEKDTNDSIFELRKKALDDIFEQEKYNAEKTRDHILNDPDSTAVEKEKAELSHTQRLLEIQVDYNNQMDILEKDFNQKSENNQRERARTIEKINEDMIKNSYELNTAMYEESIEIIQRAKEQTLNNSDIEAAQQKLKILKDERLTDKQKEIELDRIAIENQLKNIQAEIEAQKKLLLIYTQKYGLSVMTNKEAQEAVRIIAELTAQFEDLTQKLAKLGQTQLSIPGLDTTVNTIKNQILEGLNLNENEFGDLIGEVIGQSFDLATQAMNNYFDAERQRVEQSKELAYERIDIEKNQRLNQAQSAAERQTIERQAAEKKKQADKEAGEKLKKIKLAEAKIAFATELANIAVAAASNPLNGVTFGAAGLAMYGTLAGLAAVRYAMNVASIRKSQFGKGGLFGKIFGDGGKLSGPSHSDNGGMPVVNPHTGSIEAFVEGGEGIINKRAMASNKVFTVTGTPGQIASRINSIGGGVDFLGGATMKRWYADGGYFGSQVQPPVFSSYYDRANSATDRDEYNQRMTNIENMIAATNDTLNREVNRKTVISSREMSDSQAEYKKQTKIATL